MRAGQEIFLISLVALLTSCNNALISADPLVFAPNDLTTAEAGQNKREFLGRIVLDSEQKCTTFVNNLVHNQSTINTMGDIMSGTLSGVAAFTTPVATSHILSGAASIITGAKTAIDSDFYAKASIANFETALHQSYFSAIGAYASDLEKKDEASIIPAIELGRIQSIHATCGLGPAQAAISTTLAPKGGPSGAGASGEGSQPAAAGGRVPPAGAAAGDVPPPPVLAPRLRGRVPSRPVPQAHPLPPGVVRGDTSQTPYMVPGSPLH